MKTIWKTALLLVIPGALALGTPREASAQAVEVVVEPPAAFIATAAPEYYGGRPVYWYNNYWYYRDHGRWGYYRAEPGWLRDRRSHWVDRHVGYERPGYVRPAYRGAWHPAPARYRYRR